MKRRARGDVSRGTKWTRREAVGAAAAAVASGGVVALGVAARGHAPGDAGDDALLEAVRAADRPRAGQAAFFVAEDGEDGEGGEGGS